LNFRNLLERARARATANMFAARIAQAASIGLGAFILLLIAGTRVFDPGWVAALFVLSLLVLLWRTRGAVPSHYQTAQAIDRRFGLHDLLSTGWFYLVEGRREADPALAQQLREEADQAAGRIPADAAVPLAFPRAAYLTLGLFAAALALIGVRYGLTQSLDLRPPIAQGLWDLVRGNTDEAIAKATPEKRSTEPGNRPGEFVFEDPESSEREAMRQEIPVQSQSLTPSEEGDPGPEAGESGQPAGDRFEPSDGGEQGESGSRDADGEEGSPLDTPSEQASDSQSQSQGSSEGRDGSKNDPLLQKLQEAMANLLAKMKIPNLPGATKQTSNSPGQPSDKGQQRQANQTAANPEGASPTEGASKPQTEGEAAGQSSQSMQADGSQSNQAGQESDTRSQSGMGEQDGAKDLRAAEQLEAMGKIAEIFGKRSETLTGEMTAEVTSGNQRLRTPYSEQQSSASGSGGEVHRNEVPLNLQNYVQQYFEQVRKQAPARTQPAARPSEPAAP
jgi:hypothetical protein